MSDLKHQTPAQLRQTIAWCVKRRAEHVADKQRKTNALILLQAEIDQHGKLDHSIGQKEAWARYYLAQKELEGAK